MEKKTFSDGFMGVLCSRGGVGGNKVSKYGNIVTKLFIICFENEASVDMGQLLELSQVRELEEENQSYREMLNEYQTRDASAQVKIIVFKHLI